MDRDRLVAQLIHHEGVVLKPYRDTVGKLTIGVGRNLDDVGISRDEALTLLAHDIDRVETTLRTQLPVYATLDEVRQRVLCDMCFNMGIGRLLEFRRALACLVAHDYAGAAQELLASKWATQVGQRAQTLAAMMHDGGG